MDAPSDSLQRDVHLPHPLALQLPLVQFYLNQMLALAQWATTMWVLGQNQFSRYSTMFGGGAPLDV